MGGRTVLGENCPLGKIILGGELSSGENCPGEKCPGGELSAGENCPTTHHENVKQEECVVNRYR